MTDTPTPADLAALLARRLPHGSAPRCGCIGCDAARLAAALQTAHAALARKDAALAEIEALAAHQPGVVACDAIADLARVALGWREVRHLNIVTPPEGSA